MTRRTLIAVDPSLSASGWALFSLEDGMPRACGVISPPGTSVALACRFDALQRSVEEMLAQLQLGSGDILICEGPAPLVLNPNSALKVERVRGIFESAARSRDLRVPGRLNPRTVQTELLGMRGKQLARDQVKEWARETAVRLYGALLETLPRYGVKSSSRKLPQDVIDALLIGTLAVSRIQMGLRSNLALENMFLPRGTQSRNGRRSLRGWSEAEVRKLTSGS